MAEYFLHVFSKSLLGGDGAMIYNSCILEGPGNQKEMATLKGGLSDIPSKHGTKALRNPVKATAVD